MNRQNERRNRHTERAGYAHKLTDGRKDTHGNTHTRLNTDPNRQMNKHTDAHTDRQTAHHQARWTAVTRKERADRQPEQQHVITRRKTAHHFLGNFGLPHTPQEGEKKKS